MADHSTITITERPANMPPYRWEAVCSCGWTARMDNEGAVTNAGRIHQGNWGATPITATEASTESVTPKRAKVSSSS